MIRFSCQQKEFAEALNLAIRAACSTHHPVLSNLVLSASQQAQSITVRAFDLTLAIEVVMPAVVEDEGSGSILLPAKLFKTLIQRLEKGSVEFQELKDFAVEIKSGKSKYGFQGVTDAEYPEILPSGESRGESRCLSILAADFLTSLEAVVKTVSPEASKTILTGVNFNLNSRTIEMASTDGHRMSVLKLVDDSLLQEDLTAILPGDSLQELVYILRLQKPGQFVKLCIDKMFAVFEVGALTVSTRLIEGTYADYGRLIPNDFGTELTCDRKGLLQSLDRLAVLSNLGRGLIEFALKVGSKLILTADVPDVGSGQENIEAQVTSTSKSELTISFNIKYVQEVLRILNGDTVTFHLNTPVSPCVIKGDETRDYLYLCMPIQVKA